MDMTPWVVLQLCKPILGEAWDFITVEAESFSGLFLAIKGRSFTTTMNSVD